MKRVLCQDTSGNTVEFTYDGAPLRLADTNGFSAAAYTVNTAQSTGQDGENYLSSTANKRNPVITAEILSDYRTQRDRLYSFFQPRSEGAVFYYEDDSPGRKAGYYVESIDVEESGAVRQAVISLICPDPVWKALEDESISMAQLVGDVEFPAEITGEFTASHRNENVMPIAGLSSLVEYLVLLAPIKYFSMYLGQNAARQRLAGLVKELASITTSESKKAACEEYLATMGDSAANKGAVDTLISELQKDPDCPYTKAILADKEYLAKKSMSLPKSPSVNGSRMMPPWAWPEITRSAPSVP